MILDHILSQLQLGSSPKIWLDACAAPGGKTGILASHMAPGDVLIANEVISSRRAVLRENLVKGGYLNTFIAGVPSSHFEDPIADIILTDAPCAGEGMMRKDEEAIRQWSPRLVHECAILQHQIVRDLNKALKPGGILIYSTCSYSEEENIRNVGKFQNELGLESIPIPFDKTWKVAEINQMKAIGYQLFPHRVKGEGLFVAVLKKPASPSNSGKRKMTSHFVSLPKSINQHLTQKKSFCTLRNDPKHSLITQEAEGKANEALTHFPGMELTGSAGLIKGKDFIPDHFLIMSGIQHEDYPEATVELPIALDYLERNTHTLPKTDIYGWFAISHDGTLLGWAKHTPQGWKNHYPLAWRLRSRKL